MTPIYSSADIPLGQLDRIRILANEGDTEAQYQMGLSHLLATSGVKKDLDLAIRWFLIAAIDGHPGAEYQLGYIYYTGYGVYRDVDKAFKYYKSAAEKNYPEAQNNIGVFYKDYCSCFHKF